MPLIAPNHIESGTGRLLFVESAEEQGAISGKYEARSGDIIYSKIRPALRKVVVAGMDCLCIADMYALRPFDDGCAGYFFWSLLSEYFSGTVVLESQRVAMPKVNRETLAPIPLLRPPVKEQSQIAKFLDYETAKIDALIEKQQQLIALLKEKRQAVISHAVTKGLNPDAPMRDSGVEWLGEVPEHWRVGQLRRWIREMEQGKSPECESRPAEGTEWGVLKTGCVNGGFYAEQENKALPPHLSPVERYEVQDGDVLMSRASGSTELIGSVAFVNVTRPRILLSDKIFRLHFEANVDGRYFTYLMASSYMRSSIVRAISGAEGMANNITKTAVLGFPVAFPPIDEQQSIAAHINNANSRILELTESASKMLALLTERRTALISAAVTGKIDVRGWRASESETKAAVA